MAYGGSIVATGRHMGRQAPRYQSVISAKGSDESQNRSHRLPQIREVELFAVPRNRLSPRTQSRRPRPGRQSSVLLPTCVGAPSYDWTDRPLSSLRTAGFPRWSMTRSSAPVTRAAGREKSTSITRALRVKLSTAVKARICRPSFSRSETKSIDQHSFGAFAARRRSRSCGRTALPALGSLPPVSSSQRTSDCRGPVDGRCFARLSCILHRLALCRHSVR
jgi:hypothetical protein